ncbi:ELMO domain-containing C isoform X1 [Olea europaea subsp. europaea]|uniref:Transcription and mRNA export factor ENY2 n=1 Tax=Olea europaea subsp. europaea TaxID=158383 RepID=A0A8S0QW39_OLEEU|nr:ELMO domain-containing C isoform X1 [Olea europaea subsp. europaea]
MSPERIQGSCVAIRAFSPSSSFSKCSHSNSVSSDDATCGKPLWMGKGLTCVCFNRKGSFARICIHLTPLQEERLRRLRHRTNVYFDASRPDHQEALRALWSATYPGQELQSLISDQWKEMGWQGRDPSTDFRGAGFISLENLLFFAKTFSTSFQSLLKKQAGKRAVWEYPFAVAGVNITFMIMQMLDLDATKPRKFVRSVFLQMLSENEWAFDLLYCVAFVIMDKLWLEKNATYMEFNDGGLRASIKRPPTPDAEDERDREPTIQEIINIKLIESGEKERLKELLRERLIECGWRDEMKALCRAHARKKGRNNVTVDDLVHVITPKGRASVPDTVKAELLQRIRSFLSSTAL